MYSFRLTFLLAIQFAFECPLSLIYTNYLGKYVGIYDTRGVTWYEAEAYCNNAFGTNLASIHSSDDLALARAAAVADDIVTRGSEFPLISTATGGGAWIGLNDLCSEGDFVWSDGSVVDFTQWDSGEPNNAGPEHCVEYFLGSLASFSSWNDKECDVERSTFICNIKRMLCLLFNIVDYYFFFCCTRICCTILALFYCFQNAGLKKK